jgi:ribosomal protein L37E
MNCPRCGERTYVVNSRHADSTGYRVNQAILDVAEQACSWYTRDWVVRRRVCRLASNDDACDFDEITVELSAKDLRQMLIQAADGNLPRTDEGEREHDDE